jgi:hypothetical protein
MYKHILIIALFIVGCATVRNSDLDAWQNIPVEALDTHSFFITLPVIKTLSDSGVEIRDYVNKRGVSGCFKSGNANNYGYTTYTNYNAFQTCSSSMVGCDNIFYIRDGRVLEYKPVGRCKTNETVRPEVNWQRFSKPKP